MVRGGVNCSDRPTPPVACGSAGTWEGTVICEPRTVVCSRNRPELTIRPLARTSRRLDQNFAPTGPELCADSARGRDRGQGWVGLPSVVPVSVVPVPPPSAASSVAPAFGSISAGSVTVSSDWVRSPASGSALVSTGSADSGSDRESGSPDPGSDGESGAAAADPSPSGRSSTAVPAPPAPPAAAAAVPSSDPPVPV